MVGFNHLIEFVVKPDFVGEFKNACKEMKKHAAHEEGLVEMRLYQDDMDKENFYIFSRWSNADAFNQHKEKDYSKVLYKLEEKILKTKPKSYILELSESGIQQEKAVAVYDNIITAFLLFKFKSEFKDELIQAFAKHVLQAREDNENLLFEMFTIDDVPDEIFVYQIWRNKEAMMNHFNLDHSRKIGNVMNDAMIGSIDDNVNYVTEF